MLRLNKDQQRIPLGGHQFPENGHTLTADSFVQLVEKLTVYRINNHIPVGDPEQDILAHYANNWPWMVKPDRDRVPEKAQTSYEEYRAWVERLWLKPPTKFVSGREGSERATICESCPFNCKKEWPDTKESSEIARRAFLLKRGMDCVRNIGACRLHFFADLAVLSLLETPSRFVEVRKGEQKPPSCWV